MGGADFLVSGADCGGEGMAREEEGSQSANRLSWRWWPPYSSTIAFELVRMESGDHVVRVLLNGEFVRLMPRMSVDDVGIMTGPPDHHIRRVFAGIYDNGNNSSTMMTLPNFEQVVNILEEA